MSASQAVFTDYYEVLHLHPDADAALVDQAYWHLARLYNTEIPTDPLARERLAQLNEAYAVLRSPASRREYDQVREKALEAGLIEAQEKPQQVPLAVMAKQRPRPRQRQAPSQAAEPRPNVLRVFQVPPLQAATSALAILILGGAALYTGAPTLLVVAILVIGLTFSTVPLVRLPRIPKPSMHLPSIGAPSDGRRAKPTVDPMEIRRSTEAITARWRAAALDDSRSAADPPQPPVQDPGRSGPPPPAR